MKRLGPSGPEGLGASLVRLHLVSVSASTERENQDRLAADVRALRDEVGAVAAGMSEAYESGR